MKSKLICALAVAAVAVSCNGIFTSGDASAYESVNMFIATSGDHGQCSPAASVPFGVVSVCPDAVWAQHAGYDWEQECFSGISLTRLSGVGCAGAGGNLRLRPCGRDAELRIVKESEVASPGYYYAEFEGGIKCALTATRNVAVEKYVLGSECVALIDFASSFCYEETPAVCSYEILSDRSVSGWFDAANVCDGRFRMYFHIETSEPFEVLEKTATEVLLKFPCREVEVRAGISSYDEASACDYLAEQSGNSFGRIRKAAARQWKDKLGKVKVKAPTGMEDQVALFYTSLVRQYLTPVVASTPDGRYKGTDGACDKADGYTYYSSWSLWDTFRTKFPLYTVLEPEEMYDICRSLCDVYRHGKKNLGTFTECVPSVRTEHAVLILLDAYLKGVDVDFTAVYDKLVEEMDTEYPCKSPDEKIESSYDMWALAQIAALTGHDEDAQRISAESFSLFEETWKTVFMEITPDFELTKGSGLYEGSKWQYRWMAPHYFDDVISWVGADRLESQLDEFFSNYYYNQGNEPDIHAPFIYNSLGKPEKTAATMRAYVLSDGMVHRYGTHRPFKEPYVGRAFKNDPEGFIPEMDDDDATMSAWLAFCQMGFYPLAVGKPEYEVFSPIFDKVVIRPSRGVKAVIETSGRKSLDAPVKAVLLNGKPLESNRLPHSFFREGGKLVFKY